MPQSKAMERQWKESALSQRILNVYENMKVIYVYCSLRNEYESDPCSNKQYLSNSENKAWKKKKFM